MSQISEQPRLVTDRRYHSGKEWLADLGNIPIERILFDPWPGTATEKDLLHYVEVEKRLCELVDGTLVEKPMGYWEGRIAMHLGRVVGNFVAGRRAGAITGPDTTMRMKSSRRIRMPDVGFISREREPRTLESVPTISPDLAIEILSEGNTPDEMLMKRREYFTSGTRLVWMVDPRTRTVAVYVEPEQPSRVLTESHTLDGGDVLPGFELGVAEIFSELPRESA
jgi:Uma2 family endonuclease